MSTIAEPKTRKRRLRRSNNGELPETIALVPNGEDLSYEECKRLSHKISTDEEIQDEVAYWAKQDPVYAKIVEQLLGELREMDNKRGDAGRFRHHLLDREQRLPGKV